MEKPWVPPFKIPKTNWKHGAVLLGYLVGLDYLYPDASFWAIFATSLFMAVVWMRWDYVTEQNAKEDPT